MSQDLLTLYDVLECSTPFGITEVGIFSGFVWRML